MARIFLNNLRNLPVKTAAVYEGVITRSNQIGPDGGRIDGMIARAAPVVKGDMLAIYPQTGVKNAIIVQKGSAANAQNVVGMAVSEPQGIDTNTVSGNAPAVADMRRVDVALFGLAVVEFTLSSTVTVAAGGAFLGVGTASAAITARGANMALTYGAASGDVVAVLLSYSGYMA